MSPTELDAIIELIEHDDVVRAKLRAVLLSEELLAMPERLVALEHRVDALAERIDALAEVTEAQGRRIDALAERIDALVQAAEAQGRRIDALAEQVAALVQVTQTHDRRLDVLTTNVGDLKGFDLERRVLTNPLRYLGGLLRRAQVVPVGDLEADHQLADPDFSALLRADAILLGATAAGDRRWVVVEASWRAHRHDVERAKIRAEVLHRVVGEPVLPVVVSTNEPGDVILSVATDHGVALVVADEAQARSEGVVLAA